MDKKPIKTQDRNKDPKKEMVLLEAELLRAQEINQLTHRFKGYTLQVVGAELMCSDGYLRRLDSYTDKSGRWLRIRSGGIPGRSEEFTL